MAKASAKKLEHTSVAKWERVASGQERAVGKEVRASFAKGKRTEP